MAYLTEKPVLILEIISIYVTQFALMYLNVSLWSYILNAKFKSTFWWWGKEGLEAEVVFSVSKILLCALLFLRYAFAGKCDDNILNFG